MSRPRTRSLRASRVHPNAAPAEAGSPWLGVAAFVLSAVIVVLVASLVKAV